MPLGVTVTLGIFISGATWYIGQHLQRVETALSELTRDRWTLTDQIDYANQMAYHNRAVSKSDGTVGLLVPDPRDIRVRTIQTQQKDR